MRVGFAATAAPLASLALSTPPEAPPAAALAFAGLKRSTRKLIVPSSSFTSFVKRVRVVMKYPVPTPVAFSSEISAITVSAVTRSPRRK